MLPVKIVLVCMFLSSKKICSCFLLNFLFDFITKGKANHGGSSNEDDDFGNLFHNQGRISSFFQGVQLQTGPPPPRGLKRAGILGEQDEGRQGD